MMAAQAVNDVRGLAPASELESLLASRGTMSREDIRILSALGNLLNDYGDVLRQATISPETIKLLLDASPTIRAEAIPEWESSPSGRNWLLR